VRLYMRIFNGKEWWVVPLMILSTPIYALGWLLRCVGWAFFYALGMLLQILDGSSFRDAHRWVMEDIDALKAGGKYGGY
jgi:nitrate/nitrite transporter NarK